MHNRLSTRLFKTVIGIFTIIIVALAPVALPSRWQHILIMWSIWATLGMGWLLLLKVGEFSAGQAAFLCIGGYTASILTLNFKVSFWISMLAGSFASGLVALMVGAFILRLGGLYFLVISFVFAEMLRLTIAASDYLGASEGLWGMAIPSDVGIVTFSTKSGWLYLFIAILLIACFTFWRIERSRIGKVYAYIGASQELAQSYGIHIMKHKVQAFVIGALFTGLVGAAMANYFAAISPDQFTFYYSLVAQLVAILGGVGSLVWGPLLGAFLYAVFDDFLIKIPGGRSLLMGVLLVVLILFLPNGLVSARGLASKSVQKLKSRRG